MAEEKNQQKNRNKGEQDINQLLAVRREKLTAMQEAGNDPFEISKYDVTYHTDEIRADFEKLAFEPPKDEEGKSVTVAISEIPEEKIVSLAGRMMFKRVMGKASFANLRDKNGDMQIYVTRNDLGDEAYAAFKKFDVGDILGVKGFVFKTKTFQEPADFTREVPWLNGHGYALSAEICGSDHESGGQGHLHQAFADHKGDPEFPRWARIYGGRNADARIQRGRRGGTAV